MALPSLSPAFLEFVSVLVLILILLLLQWVAPRLPTTPFLERDPSLSFPLTRPETFSTAQLILISVLVPFFVVVLHFSSLLIVRLRGEQGTPIKSLFMALGGLILSFLEGILLELVISNSMKMMVGRLRPNFFALCDYAGYREASASGNFTDYLSSTSSLGVFGDVSKCQGSSADINEAQLSFPSGHSSMICAAMLWLVLYLRCIFSLERGEFLSLRSLLLTCWPFIISAFVCASRFRDHWHNPDDILFGALIGFACAAFVFQHMTSRKRGLELLSASASSASPTAHIENNILKEKKNDITTSTETSSIIVRVPPS